MTFDEAHYFIVMMSFSSPSRSEASSSIMYQERKCSRDKWPPDCLKAIIAASRLLLRLCWKSLSDYILDKLEVNEQAFPGLQEAKLLHKEPTAVLDRMHSHLMLWFAEALAARRSIWYGAAMSSSKLQFHRFILVFGVSWKWSSYVSMYRQCTFCKEDRARDRFSSVFLLSSRYHRIFTAVFSLSGSFTDSSSFFQPIIRYECRWWIVASRRELCSSASWALASRILIFYLHKVWAKMMRLLSICSKSTTTHDNAIT